MEKLYYLPQYIIPIIKKLIDKNWLVHNFPNINDEKIYSPVDFLENEDIEYTVYLDVNIYQYILNSVKKSFVKNEFQEALALLVFCKTSSIELSPSLAVYEKVNYLHNDEHLEEIIEDLNLFEILNNTNPDVFIPYIFGQSNNLNIYNDVLINKNEVKEKIIKYDFLKEWKSMYLMIMVICKISENTTMNRNKMLISFLEWMVKEYRQSFIVTIYACIFFGKKPLGKMMKYKPKDDSLNKRKNIENMTWDLYMLNRYLRIWAEGDSNKEYMFASADKVFNELLRISIGCQNDNSFDKVKMHLDKITFEHVNSITTNPEQFTDRVYLSGNWSIEYRNKLINEYEEKLKI